MCGKAQECPDRLGYCVPAQGSSCVAPKASPAWGNQLTRLASVSYHSLIDNNELGSWQHPLTHVRFCLGKFQIPTFSTKTLSELDQFLDSLTLTPFSHLGLPKGFPSAFQFRNRDASRSERLGLMCVRLASKMYLARLKLV